MDTIEEFYESLKKDLEFNLDVIKTFNEKEGSLTQGQKAFAMRCDGRLSLLADQIKNLESIMEKQSGN